MLLDEQIELERGSRPRFSQGSQKGLFGIGERLGDRQHAGREYPSLEAHLDTAAVGPKMAGMSKKHDREQMQALFARKDSEALTYPELSAESGIPVSTLTYWRKRLREENEPEVFQELVLEENDVDDHPSLEVIGPRGHRVLVRHGFDAESLRQVLNLLPC
jgi:hypothetical protein